MALGYKSTIRACFGGSFSQAIINNFAPLLFLMFQASYGIPLSQITLLITVNFGIQLVTDMASALFVDKIGYRVSLVTAHALAGIGLVSLAILPDLFENAFAGLMIAVVIYAIGGGLLEVLVSPVVEACPTPNKESSMSLLHSFYCWGYVGVVLLSTLYFYFFGIANWKILSVLWSVFPFSIAVLFMFVPIAPLIKDGKGLSLKQLFCNKFFWLMLLLMICAGASEQAVSQWASTLAEKGLGVSKTIGDLTGPMLFAVSMGLSRFIFSKFAHKIMLKTFMLISGVLCVISYLLIALSPIPALALAGCALCGFSVGIMWPGTYSLSSAAIRRGGTAMFAVMAFAGDVGCVAGPTLAGLVSNSTGDNLQLGILVSIAFPIVLVIGVLVTFLNKKRKKEISDEVKE